MENIKKKQKRVFVMSGIPGSGKSTWIIQQMKPLTDVCISRDNIRFCLLKSDEEDYFAHENQVKQIFFNSIWKSTSNENWDNIFIDATHLTPRARNSVMQHIDEDCYCIAVDFNINLTTALERNAKRSGRALVPEDAIIRMYGQYIAPTFREKFDEIWHINDAGELRKEIRE